jgi:NhaP-type Na+/H+ or K+/H+ antiporter
VSDFVWATSGVIATVAAGLVLKLLGRAMVNDRRLLEDFLTLVEHLLNTVLFTLGGVVWGAVIANGEKLGIWQAREWGYLILLYVLLHCIRALLFAVAYPITVRIGLKTSLRETVFQIYGGLRGAVGIALAIALDNEVSQATGGENETKDEEHTQLVFAFVGGIAFMTLAINGTLAGPLLRKLGLADSTETRLKIVAAYRVRFRASAIADMVGLLCQNRFHRVNFALVKHHVPFLADLTRMQLLEAVERHKATTPADEYHPPHLKRILPYLDDYTGGMSPETEEEEEAAPIVIDPDEHARKARIAMRTRNRKTKRVRYSTSNMHFMMGSEPLSAQELRILFCSILRSKYDEQIKGGELDDQHILAISLDQSLEFAADAVFKGEPLKDWEYLILLHTPVANLAKRLKQNEATKYFVDRNVSSKRANLGLKIRSESMFIERSIIFMAAHRAAEAFFRTELQDVDSELSEAAKLVMEESHKQYNMAEAALNQFDPKVVELAISHKFCKILLTMGIFQMEHLIKVGLLKESEAEPFVEEIEENLDHVLSCDEEQHPGEIDIPDDGLEVCRDFKDIKEGNEDKVHHA